MKSHYRLLVLGGLLVLLAGCQKEEPAPTAPPKGATALTVGAGGGAAPTGATSTQLGAPAKPAGAPP